MEAMSPDDIRHLFEIQHHASRAHPDVPLMVRRERLLRLSKMLDEHGPVLAAAVQADFGMRSQRLTEVADLFLLRTELAHTLRHLARWCRPRKVRTPLFLQPARGWIERQPVGVVGIISPWNYPVQLALAPAVGALAAGNRVVLKPSELTPHTSAQLAALVAQFFAPDEFCVVQGDAATAALVASLPFDHLVFTGSTAVGRKVAQAAAANLTPTTLELGGKTPCIIDADCDMQDAALKIAHGKLLNAGQTCIAPDYVLLPRGSEAAFADAFRAAVARLFPYFEGNPDYASIISRRRPRGPRCR
jgi:coniferyl-aldehyde dehydrogenase